MPGGAEPGLGFQVAAAGRQARTPVEAQLNRRGDAEWVIVSLAPAPDGVPSGAPVASGSEAREVRKIIELKR